jgi:deoxyribonuclease V
LIVDIKRLFREQERLAKRVTLYDAFGKVRYIAGADCSYFDDRILGGVVVLDYDTLEPVASAFSTRKLDFPYIPGLLAYREAPAMIAAFKKIRHDVDVLMVDGFGINHPRRFGIASHIGIKLDLPVIGVGKSFLCGKINGDDIFQDGENTGKVVHTKDNARPIYVSPGHRISSGSAVNIVENCLRGHRQPEPTRLAHEYVTALRSRMKNAGHF